MTQFKDLHVKGSPLVLFNIWDAGSAVAVAKTAPAAIATGSWAMAKAQGYEDGQNMPFTRFIETVAQIARVVDVPLTVDFEAGFGTTPAQVQRNLEPLIDLGIAGINIEDRVIGRDGLLTTSEQCDKIAALRAVSEVLFINARCDLMFDGADTATQASRLDALIDRAEAYAKAGADGFFVPGVTDVDLIADITRRCALPVNIMRMDDTPIDVLAQAGVARISHGPAPYIAAMASLTKAAGAVA